MFIEISEFCQISVKILPYLTDFSPQLLACMHLHELSKPVFWGKKTKKQKNISGCFLLKFLCRVLSFKALSRFVADNILKLILLFFRENKT